MLLLKKVTQFKSRPTSSPVLARVPFKYVVSTFTIFVKFFDIAKKILLWLTTTIAPGQSIEKNINVIVSGTILKYSGTCFCQFKVL